MFKGIQNKVFLILVLAVLVGSSKIYAQRWKLLRYEVGGGFGTSQVFGDIGGTASEKNWFGLKDISFNETRLSYGLHARYKLNTLFSVKANFIMGYGEGSDAGSRNDRERSYKARLYEFSGQFEYYFLSEEPRQGSGAMFNHRGMINNYSTFCAYAFAGLGVTYSSLSHTTGIVYDYDSYKEKNYAPVIPFGVGVKYVIDQKWFVSGEFGYRWGLNDYIEGYKQTESSKFTDLYYFMLISANYRLKTNRKGLPAFMFKKSSRSRF